MEPGNTLGNYEIVSFLGAGGMGEVYHARDTRLDRAVALKMVPSPLTQDEEQHARFHREAVLLAAFTHPHVATIFAFEESGDRHYLVMELVEGEDLSTRLERGPLATNVALEIARQIATALEAAHAKGIIHRDLKPQNVKFTGAGEVKVLDFGLAKLIADEKDEDGTSNSSEDISAATTWKPDITQPGTIMGSAAYMSPEQARGRGIDRRADIWAFGCVLYEMLTGKRAFPGDTISDTLVAVLSSEPDWTELPDELPSTVRRLLERCLRKDAGRRLHDIADARIEIEDIQADENGTGTAFGIAPVALAAAEATAQRARPRRRGALIALAVVGWLLAMGFFALSRLDDRAATPPVRLQTVTYSGRDWSPSASPDGEMVAFVSDRDGISRIWLRQMTGGAEVPLTDGPDDLPRFSPDGSQILFVRDEEGRRNAYRTGVLGGQPRKFLNDVVEVEWSPRGDEVAFLRSSPVERQSLVLVGIANIQTGTERLLTRIANRVCYGLRFAPEGARLTVNESSLTGNVAEDSNIDLIDVATGEMQQLNLTEWTGPYSAVAWNPGGDSFVVGQAPDVLSYVRKSSGRIMQYDLDSGSHRALFWSHLRQPRGGWGFTSLEVLDEGVILLDVESTSAQLLEITPARGGRPATTRTLTRGLGLDRQPAFSPDGGQVVFSSNRTGNIDLWLVDRATGVTRQLTDDPADDWDPGITPDGRHVIWSSNRSGNMEVWMADIDGSRARQVTQDGVDAENPTMTPDGGWIVYNSSNDRNIGVWKIRPDGSEATRLVIGSILLPEVSPDGRYALFVQFRALGTLIQVLEIETGELIPFEINPGNIERHQNVVFGRARWSPDGRRIYYVGQDGESNTGVYRQDFVPGTDTSATRVAVAGFTRDFLTESLGVSPDGEVLVISTMIDKRTLVMAEDVLLDDWR